MKKYLIVFLLVITLTLSAFSFVGCNASNSNGGTQAESEQKNPTTDVEVNDPESDKDQESKPGEGGNDTTTDSNIPDVGENESGTNKDQEDQPGGGNDTTTDSNIPDTDENESGTNKDQPGGSNDTTDESTVPDNSENHSHTDINDDGSCDTCYASVIVILDFYAINDLHGKFCDTDSQPGVDNLATYLKTRYEYDDNVIIFSSGDMWQGAAESNLTNGLILTEWMNELNFVSMTLGNHEFDWGEDAIRENLAVAEFPFLAINIYDKTTGKLADYCTPSIMIECDGLQIGIIGAIGDCYSSISADQVTNVEFKVGSQLTALVKAESEKLKAAGADLIIYSIHDGYGTGNSSAGSISSSNLSSYYDTALSSGYVDVVFEAHTHQKYVYYDSYGIYHLQGGGENKGITHVEFKVNSANGNKSLNQAEFVSSSTYSSYASDPATDALEQKYADIIDMAYTVIGKVSTTQSSSKLADIVSELYLEVGLEKWGDKYDIVLGGGFLKTRSPYSLAAGDVTYSDLLSLLPFDNQIVLCSIKGTYLKSKFINTTNTSYHNTYSAYGQSVKNNISNNATYYVVVDMYTAVYAPNKLTIVDYYDEDVFARDLLANEVKSGRFDLGRSSNYSLSSNNGELSNEAYCITDTIAVTAQASVNVYIRSIGVRYRYRLQSVVQL